jgi:DNA-binding beta-propeller fold protein YncE
VTPVGNADFEVLDIVAARHESAAARFATIEEDPQNPGPKMLFAWEVGAGVPLEITRASGLQVPFVPNSMAFSADGRVLAISSGDLPDRDPARAEDMVWLWDLANGAQVTFDLDAPAADLAFNPDGSLLAVSVPGKGIYLWEVATQTQRALLPGEYGQRGTPSMAFSPDGRTLAGGAEDGTVVLWDIATATELRTLGQPGDDPVLFVAYSPDGTVLAAADARLDDDLLTNGARLWEPDTGALLATLADQTEPVKALGFRSEGRELVMIGTQTWVSWAVY